MDLFPLTSRLPSSMGHPTFPNRSPPLFHVIRIQTVYRYVRNSLAWYEQFLSIYRALLLRSCRHLRSDSVGCSIQLPGVYRRQQGGVFSLFGFSVYSQFVITSAWQQRAVCHETLSDGYLTHLSSTALRPASLSRPSAFSGADRNRSDLAYLFTHLLTYLLTPLCILGRV